MQLYKGDSLTTNTQSSRTRRELGTKNTCVHDCCHSLLLTKALYMPGLDNSLCISICEFYKEVDGYTLWKCSAFVIVMGAF